MEDEGFLTRRQVANLLKIAPDTLRKWEWKAAVTGRPELAPPSLRVGKFRRYRRAHVVSWAISRSRAAERAARADRRSRAGRRLGGVR